MKKIIIAFVVLVLAAVLTYFLVFNNSSQTSKVEQLKPTSTETVNNPVNTVQPEANVNINNFSFNPSVITIKVGTKVTWTNNDSVPHQVKGDNLSSLNTPIMNNGQTYSFTFNDIGTFNYHCVIHPMMKGEIIVTK